MTHHYIKDDYNKIGKLKIFFGACAGAGKTYAMLNAAQEKLKEKVDIVVGVVETHQRIETKKLVDNLPQLPQKIIQYQGITLQEFDIDAALKRAPQIILIDELAHSNAVTSRHPKRWQDVKEILESGIDVYSTLNVQHLDSLNELIATLTGVRVKETIPDSIFDNADEIVLVDIPSEIILERLNEGKVYLGEFAKQRALENFFKIENLIVLREMALRRTAERVDALRDSLSKLKSKLPLSDKILVTIGPFLSSTKLLRSAKQLANKFNAPWTTLYVESPHHEKLSEENKVFVENTLRLAEQMGASKQIIQEKNIADGIIQYANQYKFNKILMGKSHQPTLYQQFFGSLVTRVIERSKNLDVFIITENELLIKKPKKEKKLFTLSWKSYLESILVVFVSTLIALLCYQQTHSINIEIIYLAGIIFIASRQPPLLSLACALLSTLCCHFFFIYPLYQFKFPYLHDLITLIALSVAALVISQQTLMLKLQNRWVSRRERYTAELYALSRKLVMSAGRQKIVNVSQEHISSVFDSIAVIWLPNSDGSLGLLFSNKVKTELKEESVAQWSFQNQQGAGMGTDTMPSAKGYYLPITDGNDTFGVLGVIPKESTKKFDSEEITLLQALALQVALAFERIKKVKTKKD